MVCGHCGSESLTKWSKDREGYQRLCEPADFHSDGKVHSFDVRLTNGFSKSRRHHEAMLALFFAHFNFCRKHSAVKTTPAVAAGLTSEPWSIERLLTEAATVAA
ncbi:MAG: hypothetical protein H0T47_04530 [Planctomycetaceae bacterium]|nr:hypothetical protein [Planctomycetaceae bacterium]